MWIYKNEVIKDLSDFPLNTYGFIYKIVHIPTQKLYIGKKNLYHNVKKKLTKKELAEQTGPGRKQLSKTVQKESDWKTYWGSNKQLLELIKNEPKDNFYKVILQCVFDKKLLTYYECKCLFKLGVLESPEKYFNDNIQGRFFTKDFKNI
jgi:hypothetical protein